MTRRAFKRAPQGERRHDLIQATMNCVCEIGLQATTVRNVAARAGVTNGLIRHYFSTKDHMIQEAYRATISAMTAAPIAAIADVTDDPARRLRVFIAANLSRPVINERRLSLWASFISLIHIDDEMAEIHRQGYIKFRKIIEKLISDLFIDTGKPISPAMCAHYAIKINAIIDGLWLEGCLAGDIFEPDELTEIGIDAVEAIIGIGLKQGLED